MQVYTDIHNLPTFKNAVITIGTFDGVHQGHMQIIKQLVQEAGVIDGTPVVITFYPHPKMVVQREDQMYFLNTQAEKFNLLQELGINDIVCVPFDKSFSEQTASDYIKNFLVDKFHPHTVIIGYDHKFGLNREGDYQLLEEGGKRYGFNVKEIPEHVLRSVVISSTKIREALHTGAVETANEFLGYSYSFTGIVVRGKQIGRTLGFPTANIDVHDPSKLIPAIGIYAVKVFSDKFKAGFDGMLSIGTNPTTQGTTRTIEVNIFDFDGDLYDSLLTVRLIRKLRNEEKFDTLDDLVVQMEKDKIATIEVLRV